MGYSSGFLNKRILVQNRKAAVQSKFGIDSNGPEYEDTVCLYANVGWKKGLGGLHEGALDVYGVVEVRMRWTNQVNDRSRIVYEGRTYQIIPETFHSDRQDNTIQFLAQVIINDKTPAPPTPAPEPTPEPTPEPDSTTTH
jgi:head-tail adaptor